MHKFEVEIYGMSLQEFCPTPGIAIEKNPLEIALSKNKVPRVFDCVSKGGKLNGQHTEAQLLLLPPLCKFVCPSKIRKKERGTLFSRARYLELLYDIYA